MNSDAPESKHRPEGAVETDGALSKTPVSSAPAEEAAQQNAATRVELEVELRQSIGQQLYEVLTRPTGEREEPATESRRGE